MVDVTVWVNTGSEYAAQWFVKAVPREVATCLVLDPTKGIIAMDSPRFAGLDARDQLEGYLGQLIERLTALANVYHLGHFPGRFFIDRILRPNRSRRTFTFNVVAAMPDGWTEGVATALERADHDERVSHALRLLRDPVVTWQHVYDVAEFLIDQWPPARADLKLSDPHKRTANYHRHLGAPDERRLPKSPPTLPESRAYVIRLLLRWLDEVTGDSR